MHTFSRLSVLFLLVTGLAFGAQKATDIGRVVKEVDSAITVRVRSNNPELQALAQIAFNSHGRYRLANSGQAFDFNFTLVGPNQVSVDITKGTAATPVGTQTVRGRNNRDALLRAADFAVEKTNGAGLRGFFTARLAFLSKRTGKTEVYASDLFIGSSAMQLTRDGAHALTPRWSPDASRIIYTSYFRSGFPDIFFLDPVTGRKDTCVSLKGTNSGARFSPNGRQIVMVLTGSGSHELYVSNALGKEISQRTRTGTVKSSPCWSPDGGQLVFEMGEPSPQLHIMPASGGTARRLAMGYTYVAEPDWNRIDRHKIACTVRVPGGRFQIAVHDLAANKTTVVSEAAFDGLEPAWLGDGRHLVYTARDRTSSVLCILDTETGKSTPITSRGDAAMQAGVWFQ